VRLRMRAATPAWCTNGNSGREESEARSGIRPRHPRFPCPSPLEVIPSSGEPRLLKRRGLQTWTTRAGPRVGVCRERSSPSVSSSFKEVEPGNRLFVSPRAKSVSPHHSRSGEEAPGRLKPAPAFGEIAIFDRFRRSTDGSPTPPARGSPSPASDFEYCWTSTGDNRLQGCLLVGGCGCCRPGCAPNATCGRSRDVYCSRGSRSNLPPSVFHNGPDGHVSGDRLPLHLGPMKTIPVSVEVPFRPPRRRSACVNLSYSGGPRFLDVALSSPRSLLGDTLLPRYVFWRTVPAPPRPGPFAVVPSPLFGRHGGRSVQGSPARVMVRARGCRPGRQA